MRFIIIGCGRLGAGLARRLSQAGHTVAVVDRAPDALARLGRAFGGQTVVGTGLDRAVLVAAGIEHADGLAAVTASDEVNLVAVCLARQVFRVPRAVARLDDPRAAPTYARLGIQTIATTTWGIHRLTELLCYAPLAPSVSLGDGAVDLIDVAAPPLLVGRTLDAVTVPGQTVVVAISRSGATFLPTAGAIVQVGDRLHLAVAAAAAERLPALLGLA